MSRQSSQSSQIPSSHSSTPRLTRRRLLGGVFCGAGLAAASKGVASAPAAPFDYVPPDHPAYAAVLHLAESHGLHIPLPPSWPAPLLTRQAFAHALAPLLREFRRAAALPRPEQAIRRLQRLPAPRHSLGAHVAAALQRPEAPEPPTWSQTTADGAHCRMALAWCEALSWEFTPELGLRPDDRNRFNASFETLQSYLPPSPEDMPDLPGPFADVLRGHPGYAVVEYVERAGPPGRFLPESCGGRRALTRYEFAMIGERLATHLNQPARDLERAGWRSALLGWAIPLATEFPRGVVMVGSDLDELIQNLRRRAHELAIRECS
jgi:hypothetical protein